MSILAESDCDLHDDRFDLWGPSERAPQTYHKDNFLSAVNLVYSIVLPATIDDAERRGIPLPATAVRVTSDSDSDSSSSLSQPQQFHVSPTQRSRTRDRSGDLELENAELKKLIGALRNEADELRMQTSSLKGEIAGVNAAYERLLAKVTSGPSNQIQSSYFQPFFRILQLAREADAGLFKCQQENYVGQYYWTEDSFLDEQQNGFFTATRNSQSGPIPFLVGENGLVVSNRYQEQMARFGCILFNTLRKYGMAPGAWEEIDVYALEWFCLSIRVRFLEFRLCDNHWKAETFATMGYAGWRNPRNPALLSPVAQEDERLAASLGATRRGSDKMVQVDIGASEVDRSSSEEYFLADSDLDASVSFGTRESSEPRDDSTSTSDFPPVFYDKDMSGFVEVLPRAIRCSSKPAWRSPLSKRRSVRIRGEDPPDYAQLKLEERSRVETFSGALSQKRQKLEISQGDPAWRAKPRAKEKKLFHVHERRSMGNAIAEQLDVLEGGKAEKQRLQKEANRRRKMVISKASIRHRKEDKLISQLRADAQARAVRQEQERWERLPEIRQRLSALVKYVDHVERAYRKEERFLLAQDNARQRSADRAAFLAVQNVRIERARMAHDEKLATIERLSRMLPQFASYQSTIMKQRMSDFRKKQALALKVIEEEKRRQERRTREFEEAAAKRAARRRAQAQLREAEEKLAILRRQQHEQERVAAIEETQRKARQAELEGRAAQIRAKRKAEADERVTIQRLKERTALTGSRDPEAEADGRLQPERRSGVLSHPPSTPSRPPNSASSSAQPPAKTQPEFRVVGGGGWRIREVEKKAEPPVHSYISEETTSEGSRHPGVSQIQTSSSPVPAARVLKSATDGPGRDPVALPTAGWRARLSQRTHIPAAASSGPSRVQPPSSLPAVGVQVSTKDEGHSETRVWRSRRISGSPIYSQAIEVPTSIWRPPHMAGK
ncbi:hypothetical protein BS17DRAFT_820428 [Gyrodon lividus]|nr:hypothetical protein BS17DRAFT_820428 [Gyrodon lividus]